MSLAAEFGSTVKLRFDGRDEKEASADIIKYFEDGFGEL